MLSASTTSPPIAYTSDMALAAAIAPYCQGSSTSGAKKSTVAMTAVRCVDAVDGSIVRHPEPGDEVGVLVGIERGGQRRQNLRQGLRARLGRSAAAAGQIGEPDLRCSHGEIVRDGGAAGSGRARMAA